MSQARCSDWHDETETLLLEENERIGQPSTGMALGKVVTSTAHHATRELRLAPVSHSACELSDRTLYRLRYEKNVYGLVHFK